MLVIKKDYKFVVFFIYFISKLKRIFIETIMLMRFSVKNIISILSDSIKQFFQEDCLKFSASLSYYTIFALPSFAVILISFFGYFIDEQEVSTSLYNHLNILIGSQVSNEIEEIVENSKLTPSSFIETIVSGIALFFSATGMFSEIQSSINDIWKIKAREKVSFLRTALDQFFSFSMILIFGFILAISLFLDSFIEIVNDRITNYFNLEILKISEILNLIFVFFIIIFLVFYIFKELPDAKIKFKDAFIGAFFTTILFMIGKWGISFYIENSDKMTLYGAAGSILILLLWVYYSAIILYFGAIFTKKYAENFGTPIVPNDYSEFKD